MYFQVRDYVFGCEECQRSQSERSVVREISFLNTFVPVFILVKITVLLTFTLSLSLVF